MIRVDETDFSAADVCRIEQQIRFLEEKVAANHWPKFAIRTSIVLVVVSVVFAVSRSPLWCLMVLSAGAVWAGLVFDSISTQKMQRDWLAYEKTRLATPRKKVIRVEDCDYIDYGEFEDEGVLLLFSDRTGNWLMLEGQNYYPTDDFPSSSFRLSYDSLRFALHRLLAGIRYCQPGGDGTSKCIRSRAMRRSYHPSNGTIHR